MTTIATLRAARLTRAGAEEFTAPGAGPRRRAALTELTRMALQALWTEIAGDPDGVALACTGSLARGDTGPLGDLDLIVVHHRRSDAEPARIAERLWYPLWDCGLGLDHAMRSVTECRRVAAADLNVTTALLDIGHIAGDPRVVDHVRADLAEDWRKHSRARLPELIEAVTERHHRAGDLAQLLAPDLKESRGGLRDMTVLRALAVSWLTDRPHGRIDTAHGELLDVRDAVQMLTERPRNLLTQADQADVARMLGDADADALLTRVSLAARTIANGLDATMRRARQSQQQRRRLRGPRRPELRPVGDGIFTHDSELVLGPRTDRTDALLPLRLATHADAGTPISPVTLTNLARDTPAIPVPWPAEARHLLLHLLGSGPGLVAIWEDLDQAGLVTRWLPEWEPVRSRPQRNPWHRHTVDRHSIEAVALAGTLTGRSPNPAVLLVATLLHDIGKLPGSTDHSLDGAPIARRVATRWGFRPAEVDDIEVLVREHLTLARLATTRDPDDPATGDELLAAVGHRPDLVRQLALLTEADARAAGTGTWTPWRAELIGTLARRAEAAGAGRAATESGVDICRS
ncbi:MAG: HD domain-containing protein [Propionibacterium sp.]|nr:HD domain-containing protein [Propionibacterium sp.]